MNNVDVVIIGAGPIGMVAALHLAMKAKSFVVLEATGSVGGNIRKWKHVKLFTPWSYDLDELSAMELKKSGWDYPDLDETPTGQTFVDKFLVPLSELKILHPNIKYNAKVTRVYKDSPGGRFYVQTENLDNYSCQYLFDCSGTFGTPYNPMKDLVALPANKIFFNIPDLKKNSDIFFEKNVGIIGTGHSAMQTVFEFISTENNKPNSIFWFSKKYDQVEVFEKENKYFKESKYEDIKAAIKNMQSAINVGDVKYIYPYAERNFCIIDNEIFYNDNSNKLKIDILIVNTGYVPNYGFYQDIKTELHAEWQCVDGIFEIIDPSKNTCLSVKEHSFDDLMHPEEGLFVLGQKSYGRAPSFLLKTGYAQVHSVIDFIENSVYSEIS